MLKRLVCEASMTLTIVTKGPLLVKSGHAEVGGYDMEPVRTFRHGVLEEYIPGSSLKGVLRSHFEKIVRTLNPVPGTICDPFCRARCDDSGRYLRLGFEEVSCGHKFEIRKKKIAGALKTAKSNKNLNSEDSLSNENIYRDSCPACRLFGSTSFIGRLSTGDCYLKPNSKANTKRRDCVGIDRLTGGAASGAKFNLEAVSSSAEFWTNIYLRNFECWQLGALFIILEDLKDGLIRIGYGCSRGFGEVTCYYDEVKISRIGRFEEATGNEIWGLGKFLGDGSCGTSTDDVLIQKNMPQLITSGIRTVWEFSDENLAELSASAGTHFVEKVTNWQVRETMKWSPH